MVKVRSATVASVVMLLGATLSTSLADDSWGDMAQYTSGSSVTQDQSTDAPTTSWAASKNSDDQNSEDNDKKSDDDAIDAPSNSWTQAPSRGDSDEDTTSPPTNSWTQAPAGSSGNTWTQAPDSSSDDDNEDDKSDSLSFGDGNTSKSSSKKSDTSEDNNSDHSSESTETSESSGNSWKQEPVGGSQISGGETSSTGSQTTGSGTGGSTTPSISGGSVPDGTWPTSTGTVQFAEAHIIKAGEIFDGKMQTFERTDVKCEGQTESGGSTAVFQLEAGATLKNAIIGVNQMEGVHCDDHDCTIDNVWWDDVCEDALSIKGGTASSVSTVTGGGARSADDKVIQHNGFGTVKIDGFYGEDIGKLYRSCGTCGDKARKVSVSNVYVVNPGNAIVTVNKNWNDEATLSNIWVKSNGDKVKICQWSQGNADGEPSMLGDGPSPPLCQYSESDIHINGDVSQAGGGSTPSTSSAQSSGGNDGGDNDSTEAPAKSSGGSQTSWTQPPATSSESSGNNDDNNDGTATSSEGSDDGGNTQTPASSSDGSQTSGDQTTQSPASSSTGSQTSQGTPSTSTGTVPDGTWPTSTGAVQFTEPHTIKAGEVFDGKMQTFDRSDITCSEGEGQKDTAVFLVEAGGTLKNAIIGKNQKEGVHCDDHECTIENVWWDDVCEDALSIKGGSASSVTTVINCGARSASDKVVQHNGLGTVNIDGFYAENFGKLYRSCGTCGDIPRIVTVKNVYAVDPKVSVITVNKNYGDQATLSNIWVKTSSGGDDVKVCQWSQGGDNPSNLGDGPSPPLCQYSESDVHINQDVSQAGGSTPSTSSAPATSSAGSSTSQTQWTEAPITSSGSSGDDDGGSDDNSDTSATSTGGSQISWSPAPAAPSESSENNDSGEDMTYAPSTSSGGNQTSGDETSSTGSQTGGSTTPSTSGGSVPDGTWPTSTGTVQFAEAHIIKGGEIFDGKMQTFERSDVKCEGQTESGGSTAVFQLEAGATLKNAIIGVNQMEGVHCDDHDCTIDNVWWDDVCEDALSIKGGTASSVSTVTGGGARSADDKVIQHNGFGTVKIDGFYGEDIGKLYRSCGTCGDKARKVSVSNVYVVNPGNAIVTVNKNWNDEATLSNIWVKSNGDKVKICQWSQGNADGEPSMLGDGPSPPLCQYSESDIHINGDVSQAGGGSTPSTSSASATSAESSGDASQMTGAVSSASSEESSGNDDGSETSQWTQAPSENGDGGDDASKSPATSTESSGDDKNDDKDEDDKKESTDATEAPADGGEKSDDDNKESSNADSTQQGTSSDGQSVTQGEVAGEASVWNDTSAAVPTAVKSDAATKESALMSTTTASKCNIRRKRN